jgi:hypothetical protein
MVRLLPRRPSPAAALFVEALEARIAPAVVINVGAPSLDGDQPIDPRSFNYNYAPEGEANPFRLVSGPDALIPVYAVTLGVGKGSDEVRQINIYGGQSFQEWITIKGSSATAFFTDANRNGVVDTDELTGIAFGSRLGLTVNGSINGDIIGNGGGTGSSLVVPGGPSISFLRVAGSVDGSVVAAGAINNVEITGSVERISTASGGNITFDFGLGEQTLRPFVPSEGIAGGSLNNIKVGQAEVIQAGSGGSSFDFSRPGAAGGSIGKVTVVNDPDGLAIIAGDGGAGSRGGAGGSVTQVVVFGAGEMSGPLLPNAVMVQAGDGGNSTGTGGKGGNLTNISIGYETVQKGKLGPSASPSATPVFLQAGDGGAGSVGGGGGQIAAVNVLVKTPDRPGTDEISILGGHGGAGTVRDGAGGSVTGIRAENIYFNLANPASDTDSLLLRGGNAGNGSGEGARGGNVSKVSLLADRIEVAGGAGSDGSKLGGAGGSLSRIELLYSESERVRSVQLQGGNGGEASASGRGGAGGGVKDVTALSVGLHNKNAFQDQPSVIVAGAGGAGGVGGSGGDLNNIRLFKSAAPGPVATDDALLTFRAGDGGEGIRAGGKGGAVTTLTFFGFATSPSVFAGAGGDAAAGRGGAGGSLGKVTLQSSDTAGLIRAQAGDGGSGSGGTGRGGVGGGLSQVNVQVSSNVEIRSGEGGAGDAVVGRGGLVKNSVALTSTGSATVAAGGAGFAGSLSAKGAAGGSINSALAVGSGDISIQAGNGSAGGAGGSISNAAWYAGVFSNRVLVGATAPGGSVTVQAGHGSSLGTASGTGGFIKGIAGFSSGVADKAFLIAAGDGNGAGAPVGAKGAAGGAVTNVSLFGGVAPGVILAGDGGASLGKGGNGGGVANVAAAENLNFHAISAGNGGDGTTRGGLGGSVTKISIFGDIGVRHGKAFGFDQAGAGGIFAGGGGSGQTNGQAGRVTDVTAAAISSIVAGRPTTADPQNLQLATLVDRVNLRGLSAPTIVPDGPLAGAFNNVTRPAELPSPGFPFGKPATVALGEANFVGSIAGDPFAAGANIYKTAGGPVPLTESPWMLGDTAPLDGLVAAIKLGADRNFRPQALLTVTDPKFPTTFVLLDYRNNFTTNS